MIPELGNFSLILALCLALLQSAFPIAGAIRGNAHWLALARPAAATQWLFVSLAFAALITSLIQNDFSVSYVVANSNSTLPVYYRIAAAWGGHEGSLLLWIFMLASWSVAVALLSKSLPDETVALVLGVMGLISIGFLSFMLLTSNPFDRSLPAVADVHDLNPLLQDFGMIIHPPLLYMGYVGFSVAFAFAIAALITGRLDAAWARWSRPWTLAAWMFLTLGIFLGSFWAYYELGWGGWWFWDAVENASFMPWLVGTALIHSLIVTEKRGSFKNWTVLLAIITFSLSLLGTFLVRSGILSSVHAFSTDPRRGLFILAFFVIIIGGSLILYAWRAPKVRLGGSFQLFSREAMLLVNNVLLLVTAATILLGTLYPLFIDALGLGKLSVGPPYFETVFVPLMLPVLALLAIGPFVNWKNSSLNEVAKKLRWPALASFILMAALALSLHFSALAATGLSLSAWIFFSTFTHVAGRLLHAPVHTSLWWRISTQTRSYWGMVAAHAGVAVFVIGVSFVNGKEVSQDYSLSLGEQAHIADYTFQFSDLKRIAGPNYIAAQAIFEVKKNGKPVTTMRPEKRYYRVQQMPMTIAAIDRGVTRDLYVSLGEVNKDGAWAVRVQHKPLVSWIWAGCLIIALGGLLAATDQRYRLAARKSVRAPVVPSAKPVLTH